jgi:hypothetical protein
MGLEKAIQYGKEKRKPYTDSRAFDYSCRSHGSCAWCESRRRHKELRQKEQEIYEEKLSNRIETDN